MEKAIFISRCTQLKLINHNFSRVYYGNEFCEKLISSVKDLQKTLSYVKKSSLSFTFVTPYVTDYGLEKLDYLFKLLSRENTKCEVVVNDWGVFDLLRTKYTGFSISLGRLLVKQKRGPKLIELLKREFKVRYLKDSSNLRDHRIVIQQQLPLSLDKYYKGSNVSSSRTIHDFLINQGVSRIEMDNVAQGLDLELPKDKISVSVYYPYVYITTTFFCPTASCDQDKINYLRIRRCKRECEKYVFKLRHKSMPKVIYLSGNTEFYINKRLAINELEKKGVNRVVYFPRFIV